MMMTMLMAMMKMTPCSDNVSALLLAGLALANFDGNNGENVYEYDDGNDNDEFEDYDNENDDDDNVL